MTRKINISLLLLTSVLFIVERAHTQIIKEIWGKIPMKVDSALKADAEQLTVFRRNGIAAMLRYNYGEYETMEVKHDWIKSQRGFDWFGKHGQESRKTGFSFMLSDHKEDTALIRSELYIKTSIERPLWFFPGLDDMEIQKSSDIYTSRIRLSMDTSMWEIYILDRLRFQEKIPAVVIGSITNGQRRFLVRLVGQFENGEPAKLAPPGFEVLEDGAVKMAVQFIGQNQRAPIVWLSRGLDHSTRFLLIASAASMVARINETGPLDRAE